MNRERRIPGDIIEAVLCSLGSIVFTSDTPKIHTAFYRVASHPELKDLFEGVVFATTDYFPYSPQIDFIFDGLQRFHLLECWGPDFRRFFVTEKLADSEKWATQLFPGEEERIRCAGKMFHACLEEED